MGITAYRGFLIRVLALAVAASTLTASEMALVWAEGQSPSFKSKSSPSKQYEIKRFELLPISPQPIVIGTSTVGEFVIQVEYSGKSDVTSKEISAIVDRLRVVIDGRLAPLRTKKTDFKSTDANEFFGSVAFTLEQGDVGSTFLGLILAESHQLRLLDPETNLESNVVVVRIQSFPRSQQRIFLVFLTLVCGVLIFALFALLRARRMRAEAHRLRAEAVAIRPTTRPDNSVTDDSRPPLPLPEVPKPLLTALSDGCAMVVLGSGASAQAGFPTGPAFLDLLLQRLRDRLPKGLAQSFGPNDESTSRRIPFRVGEFNKVMDAIVSAVPREQIVKEVREISDRVDPDSDFHEKLAELPWRGVLSFNWDTFAESVFIERRSRNGDWQKFGLDDAAHLAAAVRAGRRLFLRPLGDLDRPATLSLSIEEFRRNLTRWPEFKRQLGLLLQTQTFIFIGVGPDTLEQFLQSVGADLEVADQRHFALVPDSHDNGLLGATLSRFGVALLPYTADPNHRAVSDFVSSLAKRARSSAPTRRAHAKAASNELTISRIEGLRLKNIGLFDDLELKLQTAAIPGTETPWTVIFGPNGCGKSSILRAIGLAFCGNEATDAAGRLLQFGKEEGSIEVQFGSHLLRTRLIRDREVIVAAGQSTPVQAGLALVLGFPALRGAVSGNPRGVAPLDMRAPEPADLLPMVNGEVDRRLGSFKQWLINVLEQAGRGDGRALAMKALVDGIIRDVVPGEFKKLAPLDNSYVIRVKTSDSDKPSPDDVPFDDLSQGMTSIFNWLGVLAQRLYDFYPDADKPENRHAVIMIDEIDAHLHPDWQRRLVELTKKFFPNVQVLATSHSPLLAGALHKEELCALEWDPSTREVKPVEISLETYGMRSQHILTSPIFGLSSDRNPDLEQRIKRHVELMEILNPTPEQEEELERLTEELREFRYVGARPSRKIDPLTQDDIETLRKHFESAGRSAAPASAPEGPLS